MEQEKKPNYDELYEQTIIINNQNTEYEEKPHKISLGNQLNIEDTIQEKNIFGFKYEEYCDSQVGIGKNTELNTNKNNNTNTKNKTNITVIEPKLILTPKKKNKKQKKTK